MNLDIILITTKILVCLINNLSILKQIIALFRGIIYCTNLSISSCCNF